jgi:hypothetical protein
MGNPWHFSPFIHLCLLCIPGLLLAAIYAGMRDPPRREAGRERNDCAQGSRETESPAGRSPGRPTQSVPRAEWGRELFPIRELEADWSAERSARFSQAFARLRTPESPGPYPGMTKLL